MSRFMFVLAATVILAAARPLPAAVLEVTPTCAELQARFEMLDRERAAADRKGDRADFAKLTTLMVLVRAQQVAAGCR